MEMLNIMEDMVDLYLDECIEHLQACKCPRCRMDMRALTLNKLPAYYVTNDKSEAMVKYMLAHKQHKIDIHTAITEAIRVVTDKPRH